MSIIQWTEYSMFFTSNGGSGGWPRLLISLAHWRWGVPHPSRTLRRVGVGMFTQWDGRMLHRRHRVPPLHRTRPGHPPAVPWSINVAAHFPQPAVDGLSARSNTGSADARVFGE